MNPWNKHTWLLLLYVLDCIKAHTAVEYYETIVTKTYNCTSYVLNLDFEWLRFRVNQEVEKSCPTDTLLVVTELSQRSTECRIGFRYIPNQGEVMKNAKCAGKVSEILENITEFAYGTQWGCPETAVSVKVTEYYHLGVHVPNVHTMALSETHAGECYVPSLQWTNPILFQCRMNTYGGYAWVASNPKACELPEFSNPTKKMMKDLSRSPIYCSLRIFLYYGYLLQQNTQLKQRLTTITTMLTTECQDFKKRWIYQNARVDYHRLIDLLFISLRKFDDHQMPAFR
ncbi:hypothetical protein FGIG_05763 [Fasciola gigantica]|uniref:Uncharacterized protein n=1 Tax=Fasciola gigantica TaxID=46835 RepID=A0A504YHB9_FASGI|nr:hypothetical protein FGIG_05763 [Fasciola gigantica]